MAASSSYAIRRSQVLRAELEEARQQTDSLFDLIGPGALYARPIAERHRLIFYLGHFEAFDFNVIARRSMNAPSFHPEFDQLFERGIDPAPGEAPMDSPRDWPAQSEVARYSAQARAWIDAHLEDADPWVVQMAIEHRHMHAETFAYLLHGLPHEDKKRPAGTPVARSTAHPAPANPLVSIAPGTVTLGQSRESFGWD